jgi:hypothetical protein
LPYTESLGKYSDFGCLLPSPNSCQARISGGENGFGVGIQKNAAGFSVVSTWEANNSTIRYQHVFPDIQILQLIVGSSFISGS